MATLNNFSLDYTGGNLKVCITGMWPSVSDLISAISIFPETPPYFGDISIPSLSAIYKGAALIGDAIKQLIMSILDPLLKVMGMTLDSFFAGLQSAWEAAIGFSCRISDIITGNVSAIVIALKAAWNSPSGRSALSWIPSPLFGGVGAFSVEIMHTIQEIMQNFYLFLVTQIANLVTPVVNAVMTLTGGSFSLPSIPTLPTMPNILAMLKHEMIAAGNNISLAMKAVFAKIGQLIPVLSSLLDLIPPFPHPFIPHMSMPDIEIQVAKSMSMQAIIQACVSWISDNIVTPVVNAVRTFIAGIQWPPGIFPFCITIPILAISEVEAQRILGAYKSG